MVLLSVVDIFTHHSYSCGVGFNSLKDLKMAPKKGGKDKKEKKPSEDDEKGPLQSKAFTKDLPTECANLQLEPLPLVISSLDRGEEGDKAFLRMAVHSGIAPNFTPKHTQALTAALLPYSYLQRLCFWSVGVADAGCVALGKYLIANRSVHTLELTDCGVGTAGCKILGEALERNATLLTLRLDHNRSIGSPGAAVLGDCLCRNRALQTVSLTFCGLEGDVGAQAVISGFFQAPMLNVLELKGNRFGVDGILTILRTLRSCAAPLFRIDLADTGFGMQPEVHAAIEDCFLNNKTCCEYALAGNEIGDSTAYRWLNMIKSEECKTHLIYVDVTNRIDPLLFKQIGDETAKNKKDWLKAQKKKGKGGKGKKKK